MSSNSVNKNQQKIIADLTKFKNGVTRQQMKNDVEKSIFDTLDVNLDGKLDDKEQKATVKGKINGKEQLFVMIKTLSNGNMIVADATGKEWVRTKDGKILNINKNYLAEQNANRFYEIADNNLGLNSIRKMQKFLDTQINSDNVIDFLDKYDKSKKGDSSIIDTITSEIGASSSIEQKKVLDTIMQKLTAAAKKAGVSQADINKANSDFQKAYNAEYKSISGKFRKTNPKDMEKAMDSLRGTIKAKQTGAGAISDKDAIKQFKKTAVEEHNTAARNFNAARREEGWAAKTGDTICGWFGCNTRADIYKKFGNNKALVDAMLNAKTETEFKNIYENGITTGDGKKVPGFGVPFDASKLAARQKALGDYQHAVALDNTIKNADEALSFKNSDYWQMASKVRNNFDLKDDELNAIIESYAMQDGKSAAQIDKKQKKEYLAKFLNDTKANATAELKNTSKGKSLEQMENDLNLITRSAFGTGDIGKDQMQFDENQMITGMITEAGAEIAGTIALQFIPGLGQVAAARLAANSAKWGVRAVKVTKALQKAEKGLATVQKFQTGQKFATDAKTGVKAVSSARKANILNKTAQVTSQMTSAGVATGAVGVSDLKSKNFDLTTEEGKQRYEEAKKEVGKKILMNMSFAGVGAGSSMIAEKLAATYGIESLLAKEIAEEVMNAAGSYGVTKAAGDDYGSSDAFVDLASGLIISRISHVKGAKPQGNAPSVKPNPDTPTAAKAADAPSTPKADVASTPKPEPAKPQPEKLESQTIAEPKSPVQNTQQSVKDLDFDELFGDLNVSTEAFLDSERKFLITRSGFSEETLADIDFETAVDLNDLCKDCDTILLRYQNAVNNEHFVFERDIYNKPTEYLEGDSNSKKMALLVLNSNPKYQAIFERIGANKFINAETEGLHLPEPSTKAKPQENNASVAHTDNSTEARNFNDLTFEDIFGDLDFGDDTEIRNYRIKNLKEKGFDESLLQEIDTESLSFIDEMATEIDKYEYLRDGALRKEDFNLDDVFAKKDYTPEQAEILRNKLQQNPKYKDFFENVSSDTSTTPKVADAPSTPKIGDEAAPKTKPAKPQPSEAKLASSETQEWRKIKVGGEEIEVPVTKNADGTDNVDFSKGRKLNDSGEYEYFDMTNQDDIMANSSTGEKQGFFSRLFGKKTPKEVSQIEDKQLRKQVENTLEHYSCDLNENIHHNSIVSSRLSDAVMNKGSMVKTLNRTANLNNISAYTASGEVCSVGNRLYVNENGKAVELKISKDKFEQLFPSEESMLMTEQMGGTDTCWSMSIINTNTQNGYGRAQVYKALAELPDGSMVVHLKAGTVKDVVFPDGKPLPVSEASMGDNAAAGLSMIEQAILATAKPYGEGRSAKMARNTVQLKPGQTMADMDFHDLMTNACSLCYSGDYAMGALFTPKWATKTNKDVVKVIYEQNSIQKCIEEFNPKTDFLNAVWSAHQKSIIGYDPATKIVTFHDPYNIGAVNTQCTLDEFVSQCGSVVYYKTPKSTKESLNTTPSTVGNQSIPNVSQNQNLSQPTQTQISQNQTSQPKPNNYTEQVSPQGNTISQKPQYQYQFEEKTTKLSRGQFQPVAKTIEGNNIDAMISSNDGSIIIRKDGKEIPISVEPGNSELIHETSTDTYLIVTKDNNGNVTVKTSETGDMPEETLVADSSKNISSKPASDKSNSSQQYNHSDAKIRPRSNNTQTRASGITRSLDGTPKNIGTAGKPIMARITGRPSGDTFTVEINGHTWNIKDNEPLRYPGGITITKKGNDLIAQTSSQTPATQPASSQIQQKRASANIPIPQGFREYGKVMGKRAIINANNVVMYETAHGWKKLN